jgi:hypothetical protein
MKYFWTCCVIFFSFWFYPADIAIALVLQPTYDASQSKNISVGELKTDYDYRGDDSGFPTMVSKFENADMGKSIDDGCQLRWFQVVTRYDPVTPNYIEAGVKPATYKNKGVTLYGMPFTDPPRGGYDYQQPAGDDSEPFYWNTLTEWPLVQEEGSYSLIVDTPKRYSPGITGFQTCLVLYCPDKGPKTIYLLENGCFSWELNVAKAAGSLLSISTQSPMAVPNVNSPTHIAFLQTGLDNAGFSDWNVEPTPFSGVKGNIDTTSKSGYQIANETMVERRSSSGRAVQMPTFPKNNVQMPSFPENVTRMRPVGFKQ